MAARLRVDWEAIERDYRAGLLSVREIARNHGCSHAPIIKRASENKWSRDLSEKVRREARAKATTGATGLADEPRVIEAAATEAAQIIRRQRADLDELQEHERKLLADLQADAPDAKGLHLPLTDRAKVLKAIGDIRAKRIDLERRVWNLDEPATPAPGSSAGSPTFVAMLPPRAADASTWRAGVVADRAAAAADQAATS